MVEAVPKAQPTPTVENQPEEKATPAPKVLDFSAAKNKAPAKEETAPEKKSVKEQAAEKPKRGRPAKADKAAPAEKPKQPRDKMPQSKKAPGKEAPIPPKREVPSKEAKAPEQEQPAAPRDATRSAEPEQIVYLNLSDLHPFKNHPFGVRDDAEMQGLVESVKAAGVNQPAPVRPREDGGYEVIVGNRRKQASELAGLAENGGREKADVHPNGGDIIHPPQKSEVKSRVSITGYSDPIRTLCMVGVSGFEPEAS